MKKCSKLFLLTFLLLMPGMVVGESGEPEWYWVRPKPTGNDLTSVKFINSMTGYACGNNGDVIKTTNGGVNWTLLDTPETRTMLLGIGATDGGKIIAVGINSTALLSLDYGLTWNQLTLGITNMHLSGVEFLNDQTGYIAGFTGELINQSHIFRTTDGGTNWTLLPNSPPAAIQTIKFYNSSYGIISGKNATYITTNAGLTWNVQSINYVFLSVGKCITFLDSLNIGITLAGEKAFTRTTNGGQNWIHHDLSTLIPFSDNPEAHTYFNDSTWIIISRFGRVMKTTNRGISWHVQETHTNLWWVESLSDNFIVACGRGGTILKSTNSGTNWNTLMGGYQSLNHLVFVNQSTGFACGNRGTIIKTTDQGETWNDLTSGVTVKLNQLHFINETTGYCVGDTGTFLKTTNSGDDWVVQNSGTNNEIYSVYFHNEQNGVITPMGGFRVTTDGGNTWSTQFVATFARFRSIIFLNETTGVSTAGPIYRTANGGFNWVEVFNDGSYGGNVFFVSNEYGIYSGMNKISKSTNQGANWQQTNNNFNHVPVNIFFGSQFIGLASHGVASFVDGMSKTTDGGNTWKSYPMVSANINNWITFLNANTGIAVDGRGGIIKTKNEIITDVELISNIVPEKIELFQNYPNPFNSETKIKFSVPHNSKVKIIVSDITGRTVSKIVNAVYTPGTYEVSFNMGSLPSGVYFYSLYTNNKFVQSKKLIIIR